MTKRIGSRYKVIRQNYIDIWENGKRGVKSLKKVYVLNILMFLIEKKKKALKVLQSKRVRRNKWTGDYMFLPRWHRARLSSRLFSEANSLILPFVEKVLKSIPRSFMDLNKKTRVYKYIRRNNKKLFLKKDRIVSELVLILERKRRKPSWRRTPYEVFFRKFQLLKVYYGGMTLRWLRRLSRQSKFQRKNARHQMIGLYQALESRLDIVIFRSGLVHSIYESRQCIIHKKVYINGTLCSQPGALLREGDVISWDIDFFEKKKQASTIETSFSFYHQLKSAMIIEAKKGERGDSKRKYMKKKFPRNKKLDKKLEEKVQKDIRSQKKINSFFKGLKGSLARNALFKEGEQFPSSTSVVPYASPAWDGIEQSIRYTRFKHLVREVPNHLLFSEKASIVVFVKKPSVFLYPFDMTVKDIQAMVRYLSI